TPKTWGYYKQMRDNCLVMLDGLKQASMPFQASIKVLRLSQITSGFLGGVGNFEIEVPSVEEPLFGSKEKPEWMKNDRNNFNANFEFTKNNQSLFNSDSNPISSNSNDFNENKSNTQEIGREKLDTLLWFLEQQLDKNPNFRTIVWCRFRLELF